MNESPNHSPKALFRYSVVSKVLALTQSGYSRTEAIRLVCAERQFRFDGSWTRVYPRSIYRWITAFTVSGLPGLEPRARLGTSTSNALSQEFIDFFIVEKRKDHPASIPEIIRRARCLGVIKTGELIHRSTVYRLCRRLGLPLARCRSAKHRDSRRFAHTHRMDMVLCDGKHFRVGEKRCKRVALFFIDDATRMVLGVVVGSSETKELFLRGLYACIHRYGLMDKVFVDNGPGFIATDSLTVFANLGILLIHGEKGYKEGHGKVERFNRTIKADVLRGLDGQTNIDTDCTALQLRLEHYIERGYAERAHESLGGDTPAQRFHADSKPLHFPPRDHGLLSYFEIYIERRVSNDHIVSVDGIDYEMPRGYAGYKVTVRRRVLEAKIIFLHQGVIIELHPVDLAGNARARRAKSYVSPSASDATAPPITAAQLAFDKHFKPVVDHDGGFTGDSSNMDAQQNDDQSDTE